MPHEENIRLWNAYESICIELFEMPHEATFVTYIFSKPHRFSDHWHEIVDEILFFKCPKRNWLDDEVYAKVDSFFE